MRLLNAYKLGARHKKEKYGYNNYYVSDWERMAYIKGYTGKGQIIH